MIRIPNFKLYYDRYFNESSSEPKENASEVERFLWAVSNLLKYAKTSTLNQVSEIDHLYTLADAVDNLWTDELDKSNLDEKVIEFAVSLHESLLFYGNNKAKFCFYFKSKMNDANLLLCVVEELYKCRLSITTTRAFQNDYDRIVSSSAFRRLQDKAQVFSLESFDFVRTRLTHSNEVSAISEQLVTKMMFQSLLTNENVRTLLLLSDICRSVSLLHDIGNPPFGHYGESIIRRFFLKLFSIDSQICVSSAVANAIGTDQTKVIEIISNPQMVNDFVYFDGNAQAFRIVNNLQPYRDKPSLNLTASILRGMLKYPCNSSNGIENGKFGYFQSESSIIDFLKTNADYEDGRLYLPALIMEVADDIAYNISDFEDALKKGLITFEDFMNVDANNESVKVQQFISDFKKFYDENRPIFNNPFEVTISSLIQRLKIDLISEAAFVLSSMKNIAWLLDRTSENRHVLDRIPSYSICQFIKAKFIKPMVYSSRVISETELEADTILTYLLDEFTRAVLLVETVDSSIEKSAMNHDLSEVKYKKIINLISPHILKSYKDRVKEGISAEENLYYRLRVVVDYISGMTDSFAKHVYSTLTGK